MECKTENPILIMNFWKLLFRFIPIYIWRIFFYILLNVFSSVVNIISFSAIIPLLYILFGLSNPDLQLQPWDGVDSLSSLIDVTKNNILYSLQEQITRSGTFNAILIICTFIVTLSFLSNIISYFAYFVRIPIRTSISRDLRSDIYDKLITLPPSAYRGEYKGDFIGRMTTDIEEVDYGIGTAMDMLIENPVQIIVYLITLYGISVSLASYATIMLIVVCLGVVLIGRYMKSISLKGQGLKGKLISQYEETIEKSAIIQVFSLRLLLQKKFKVNNDNLKKIHNRMNRVYSIAYPLTDFMSVLVMAIVLFIGGTQVISGNINIDAAELIYFIIIFHSIIRPTRSIIKATYGIRKAIASLERMEHILNIDTLDKVLASNNNLKFSNGEFISFNNVSFSYTKDSVVFERFHIRIPIGNHSVIIGQNGIGKTTLVKLLLGLEKNFSGDIYIGNTNIKDVKTPELQSYISYVPQDTLLFNDSIKNNILVGKPDATDKDIIRVAKLANIHEYILSTRDGYNTIIGEQGMNLSGGQRQCISIARALLKNAPVLILDEATSGIDKDTETIIFNNILEFMSSKTLIVISHSSNIVNRIPHHIQLP